MMLWSYLSQLLSDLADLFAVIGGLYLAWRFARRRWRRPDDQ